MPRIALLVGRHLHYIEDYARYPGANERGIAEIRTRQGLKQEAVGLPGGSAYDQGELSLRRCGLRSQRCGAVASGLLGSCICRCCFASLQEHRLRARGRHERARAEKARHWKSLL